MVESKENFEKDKIDEFHPEDSIAKLRKEIEGARSILAGPRMGLSNELVVKTKRFIEEAEERLAKSQDVIVAEQVEEVYRELVEQNPGLKSAIEKMANASKPPEEFSVEKNAGLFQKTSQKAGGWAKPDVGRSRFASEEKGIDGKPEQGQSYDEFLVEKFKISPNLFKLYENWLDDTLRLYATLPVEFGSLSPQERATYVEIHHMLDIIRREATNKTLASERLAHSMAYTFTKMVDFVKSFGVPDQRLTESAFNLWLQSRGLQQGGAEHYFT